MAWGKPDGTTPAAAASELVSKASATGSVVVMPFRKFGDVECAALCELLATNATVTELKASGHKLGVDGALAVGKMLGNPKCGLRHLAVGHSEFGSEGLQALVDGLNHAGCPLETLDLGFKGLCASDGDLLCTLLTGCSSLRTCVLCRNVQLGAAGVGALFESPTGVRPAFGSSLTTLDLSETGIDAATLSLIGRAAATDVIGLRSLDLSQNPGVGGSSECSGAAIAKLMASLHSLKLRGCGLTSSDGSVLGSALMLSPAAELKEVFLDDNPLLFERTASGESQASYELIEGLALCPSLNILTMGDCAVTDAVAKAIGDCCQSYAHFTDLDLRSNRLSAVGFADVLRLPKLLRLSVFNNPQLGSASMWPLALACHLQTLDLGACQLTAASIKSLSDVLCSGDGAELRCLELFGNGDMDSREVWRAELARLREARPGLDIAWKEPAGDQTAE